MFPALVVAIVFGLLALPAACLIVVFAMLFTRTLSRNMREAKNQDILMETMCNVLLERRMAAASAREVPEPAPARAAQSPAPPVVRAELGEWLCEACTLINKKEAAHWCEVCGAPRTGRRVAASGGSSSRSFAFEKWKPSIGKACA